MAFMITVAYSDVPATLKKFEKEFDLITVVKQDSIFREIYFEQKPEPTPRVERDFLKDGKIK